MWPEECSCLLPQLLRFRVGKCGAKRRGGTPTLLGSCLHSHPSAIGGVYIEFDSRRSEFRRCFCGIWLPASAAREPSSSTKVARPGCCVATIRSRASSQRAIDSMKLSDPHVCASNAARNKERGENNFTRRSNIDLYCQIATRTFTLYNIAFNNYVLCHNMTAARHYGASVVLVEHHAPLCNLGPCYVLCSLFCSSTGRANAPPPPRTHTLQLNLFYHSNL